MTRLPFTYAFLGLVACLLGTRIDVCSAQEIKAPDNILAGEAATISTTGSGKASFYLIGPGTSRKAEVNLDEDISIQRGELRTAGEYLAVLCSATCRSRRKRGTSGGPSMDATISPTPISISAAR